ncbi:MAG: M56 family metallopeptidase [Phycisphaeraceae bacterium]|nr:M56 family metallopeptidase [Phycisphaeraceae bacterium]
MYLLSGDIIDLALRGSVILAMGHLLVTLIARTSASLRAMVLTLSMFCLLALPLMWISLPTWDALPSQMTLEPYTGMVFQPIAQEALIAQQPQNNIQQTLPIQTASSQPITMGQMICNVSILGIAVSLLPLLLSMLSLRLLHKNCSPVTDIKWHELLESCLHQLEIHQKVLLLQSSKRAMPMTWGWWRPKLLIPSEADHWPLAKQRAVLLHELAHIKRRDCLLGSLCYLACSVHWFNPLAWWALFRLRNLREQACDNMVLAALDQDKASDYAQHLLDIAVNLHSPIMSNHASIAMARHAKLEGRLLAILDPRKHRQGVTKRLLISMMLLFAIAVVPLAILRADLQTDETQQTQLETTQALPALAELDGEIKTDQSSVNVKQDSQVKDIFAKVLAKYKALQTYQVKGTAISDIDSPMAKIKSSTSFSILIKKPNLYLITWTTKNSAMPNKEQSGAAWSDGTQPYLYMGQMNAYSKMISDEVTIGAATGISGGVAYTIPSLILSAFAQLPPPFDRLTQPTIEKIETIADDECYVISGSSILSKKETYWISKSSHLIRKYSRSLEPSALDSMPDPTDEQLEEAVKAMGMQVTEDSKKKVKEMMEASRKMLKNSKIKGTIAELHSNVSSPQLNKEDFTFTPPATAELKESLFGKMFGQPSKPAKPVTTQPVKVRPIAKPTAYVPSHPNWRKRFDQVYRLNDDELIRRIAPPFIPERMDYYNVTSRAQAQAIPRGPNVMTFKWEQGQAQNPGITFGNGIGLSHAFTSVVDLHLYELICDQSILDTKVLGDWIVRPDQSMAMKFAALEKILDEQVNLKIHFEPSNREQDVIVVRGRYKFNSKFKLDPSFSSYSASIHIYSDTATTKTMAGGGYGNMDAFLDKLRRRMNIHIVNEMDNDQPTRVSWTNHSDSYYGNMGANREQKINKTLAHLSEQTSLQFSRERRMMPTWVVTKTD